MSTKFVQKLYNFLVLVSQKSALNKKSDLNCYDVYECRYQK